MKIFVKACLITLMLMNLNCANQRTPTGGPKDTIPPTLTSTIPINATLNFSDDWIEMSFDDDINTTTLKKNLIISPRTELEYSLKSRKNTLRIEFDAPLLDSTTYTFNFLKGVTDLTEKNAVVNLALALSTGPYIDSLYVMGRVTELYTQQPVSGVLVGLYPYSDSLDLTINKPLYFTTTNDSGLYALNNIKDGAYKLFAFTDENSNFSFEANTESHGLLPSLFDLTANIDSVDLVINFINSDPLKLISSRSFGSYFNIRYTKPITSYHITYLPPHPYTFHHHLHDEGTSIRLYPPLDSLYDYSLDSTQIIVTVRDTIKQQASDTLNIKFQTSTRKPEEPSYQVTARAVDPSLYELSLSFNKPIDLFDSLDVLVKTDTLLPITTLFTDQYQWNNNRTALSFLVDVPWPNLQDSLNSALQQLHLKDSLILASRNLKQTNIVFDSACFVDADGLALSKTIVSLKKMVSEDFGTLIIRAATAKTSFIIQILDERNNIFAQRVNQKDFTIDHIIPGSYTLRVLIDDDLDGVWSVGNFRDDSAPESIYLYPKSTKVPSNWEISIDDLSF